MLSTNSSFCELIPPDQPYFLPVNYFMPHQFNPIALGKAKIAYNFGLSDSNRVKKHLQIDQWNLT